MPVDALPERPRPRPPRRRRFLGAPVPSGRSCEAAPCASAVSDVEPRDVSRVAVPSSSARTLGAGLDCRGSRGGRGALGSRGSCGSLGSRVSRGSWSVVRRTAAGPSASTVARPGGRRSVLVRRRTGVRFARGGADRSFGRIGLGRTLTGSMRSGRLRLAPGPWAQARGLGVALGAGRCSASAGDFTVGAPRLKAASRSSSFTRCYSLRCAREGRPELKENAEAGWSSPRCRNHPVRSAGPRCGSMGAPCRPRAVRAPGLSLSGARVPRSRRPWWGSAAAVARHLDVKSDPRGPRAEGLRPTGTSGSEHSSARDRAGAGSPRDIANRD